MLERDGFRHLIPHRGAMCLLDRVIAWDQQQILCATSTHRAADHPLAEEGKLHAVCAVEYAAQAVALHGGLQAECSGRTAEPGFLASIRRLDLAVARLDDIVDELIIRAECELADARGLLYDFQIDAGSRRVARGRLSVLFRV